MSAGGKKVLEGLEEALRFARGEDTGAVVWQVPVLDAADVRKKTGLSQEQFAQRFGINLGTLRNWEQGVREPEGPARILLLVIDQEPEAVERALKAWRPKRMDAALARSKKARAKAAAAKFVRKRKRV